MLFSVERFTEIIGARTHNLKGIRVRIPHRALTVITGVSGSGKSSLAFDTLFAEGQRRYVESLSTYARQFIEQMARPDVDEVHNIQPAIAIEQKNSVKNARSTIGTATEIYDYLRLLYAKAGVTICPDCNEVVREDTPESVTEDVLRRLMGCRVWIVAPFERKAEVGARELAAELVRAGYGRVLVLGPDGRPQVVDLDPALGAELEGALSAESVRLLMDRLVVSEEERERLSSSVAAAFRAGHGRIEIWWQGEAREGPAPPPQPWVFFAGFRCNRCARTFPRPEPLLFSFNSPVGACPECHGFGRVTGVDWDKVIPDRSLTLRQHPIAPFNTPSYRASYKWIRDTADPKDIPWDKPLAEFTPREWNNLLYGCGRFEGLQAFFDWLEKERYKVQSRILVARYRGFAVCPKCHGARLVPEALAVKWAPARATWPPRTIAELTHCSIGELLEDFVRVELTDAEEALIGRIWREILSRLTYLVRVGLGYLTLDRQTRTLSGGEAQRINLATALGTALTDTLYVLDEPTVGLHPRDTHRLLEILRDLRDNANTVVVVEHDPEIILGADHVIDLGPRAGSHGGEVVFEGPPAKLLEDGARGLTAEYLRRGWEGLARALGDRRQESLGSGPPKPTAKAGSRRARMGVSEGEARRLVIHGAREHNLKHLTVEIPLGKWVCVTGVSGSGKSTLVHQVLYRNWLRYKKEPVDEVGRCERIEGFEHLDEIILIDQTPIGRSVRSNPVTYVKAYDPIRKLFAQTREARTAGLRESAFSFNVAGGRCETCEGTGVVTYDMHFLAEVTLPCEICGGKRFMPRVLEVRWRGKNIAEVLDLTVDDAVEFFAEFPAITRKLEPLRRVGLGYLTLGQSTATLSGGEAQRLKLAAYLDVAKSGERTLMIFDEPTTGLHLADLDVLARVFRQLVERGYSLLIIEHNLEMIRQADWIIDLGPEGGDAGGFLVAQGPPEAIASEPHSHTGHYLRPILSNSG
ncbi:MAG: excinuclease ABC subunit UvrA [Candidatus Sumerlaea chitinivorans]|nr:excinuclease ABC subunit UvrA [Candidatus Sumerlaea chitinivorans]